MRKILLFLLFCLCAAHLYAQKFPSRYTEGTITKEGIVSDLDVYAKTIAQNHVSPFTCISKADFFAGIEKLKEGAATTDIDHLLIAWLQLNARIHDEHTNILYENMVRDRFPFNCYWFEEGIVITKTNADNLKHLFSKVVAINNMPINEVVERIRTIVPDTNFASLKDNISRYLFDPYVLHGLGITNSRSYIVFTLLNLKNDTVKITPAPADVRDIHFLTGFDKNTFLRSSIQQRYGYRFTDTGNCLYFKYASCMNDKRYPFKALRQRMEEDIDDRKPKKIIIDLRDNGGGRPSLLGPFITYLNSLPQNKKGSIYVLVGRKTFSAAILNTVQLKNETYATIIGEPTSGSVTHFGSVKFMKLPETHITIMYSTQYVATSETYDGSLRPDVLIPERFADYSSGFDAAVNYAMTH